MKILRPFELIILQPTSFCNINCSYCYLSEMERDTKGVMPDSILHKICESIFQSKYITLVDNARLTWHAGEPLVVGVGYYEKAIRIIKEYLPTNFNLRFEIVTNGLLINEKWCMFFKENNFDLALSIDGPKEIHDLYRKKRNGEGSFDLVMQKLKLLSDYDVKYTILTTITSASLTKAKELYDFYKSIGAKYVGVNFEEVLAFNEQSSLTDRKSEIYTFIEELYSLTKNDTELFIREFEERVSSILADNKEDSDGNINSIVMPLSILNFDKQGNFSTFSPELLSLKNSYYGDFIIGNVMKDTLESALQSNKFHLINEDIVKGTAICKNTCEYYNICGGGAPSSRLSANGQNPYNGRLCASETDNCIVSVKMIGDIIANDLLLTVANS
ncbi:MAG: GRRM system radical SAM/SPASM domain protein [Cytophagales bacterium]|nr:MAG: GRRM system radical SAM/SPASM domain protein [Cytophagales bacterium]